MQSGFLSYNAKCMKSTRNLSISLIAGSILVVLLPLLALLQYRWLGQVSEAERGQMTSSLQASAHRISDEFDQEITRAYLGLLFPGEQVTRDAEFAARYHRWSESARDPRLVKHVYFIPVSGFELGTPRVFSPGTGKYETTTWPEELSRQKVELEEKSAAVKKAFSQAPPVMPGPPTFSNIIDASLATITAPLTRYSPGKGPGAPPELEGFVLIQFDQRFLLQEFIPALVKQDADTNNYDVVIVERNDQKKMVWGNGSLDMSQADTTQPMFNLRGGQIRDFFRNQPPNNGGNNNNNRRFGFFGGRQDENRNWELRMRHRSSSLSAAVAKIRRRNLMISSGILVVLMASIGLLMLSVNRARKLAQQQMDFVAAISHELRTPLAVIDSAGFNLTRGVIKDQNQVTKYGTLIRKETQRLTEMVEQILEFSGVNSNKARYALQPSNVEQIISEVVSATSPLIEEGGFDLTCNVAASLPPVLADSQALSRAIQNLLNNAMKYSGTNKSISLNSRAVTGRKGLEVEIEVVDHGIGIPVREQSHVFEPFYRGDEAKSAQIHGNGLGLSLVKSIVQAHQGRISLESTEGKGSRFTISLPAIADEVVQAAGVEATV